MGLFLKLSLKPLDVGLMSGHPISLVIKVRTCTFVLKASFLIRLREIIDHI